MAGSFAEALVKAGVVTKDEAEEVAREKAQAERREARRVEEQGEVRNPLNDLTEDQLKAALALHAQGFLGRRQ